MVIFRWILFPKSLEELSFTFILPLILNLSLVFPCFILKLNSFNTLDFFKKLELIYPGSIKSVQTDKGLEFLGVFAQYLRKKKEFPHYFIYPRCPRIDGVIERYQRTIQEEFLEPNLDLIHQPKLFNDKLGDLLFYNSQKVHESLGLKSPLDYLPEKGGMSKKSVACTDG